MAKILGAHIPEGIKNYVINGDMRISQRGTSFASAADGVYYLDRYRYAITGAAVHTISQDTDVPSIGQAGYLFQNSLRLNLTTADASIAATDRSTISQRVEGFNWANLAQKTFTLSFWVKATLPGIYCVSFRNGGADRSYVSEYTINGSASWEYKSVTVSPSPAAGTWNYANGSGLIIDWALSMGSTFQTTPGAWQTGNFFATANQVNGTVNTSSAADFRLTGVMLNEGSMAFPFKLFASDTEGELSACQRYYEKSYNQDVVPGTASSQAGEMRFMPGSTFGTGNQKFFGFSPFKVTKRAVPTVLIYDPVAGGTAGSARNYTSASGFGANASNPGFNGSPITSNTGGTVADQSEIGWQFTAEAEL